jgi:hypothetical protein
MENTKSNGKEHNQDVAGSAILQTANSNLSTDLMECPLCIGRGELRRSEVLERLGMKDFARVAQLSAEEAFRILLKKQKEDESAIWLRFEAELTKRTSEILQKHRNELHGLQSEKSALELRLTEIQRNQESLLANTKESERLEAEKRLRNEISPLDGEIKDLQAAQKVSEQRRLLEVEQVKTQLENKLQVERTKSADLNRNTQDYLVEIAELRDSNHALKVEMSKIVRVGRREEVDFAEEARLWPGIWVSERLKKNGDYILAYRDPSGSPTEPQMVLDNKDKDTITGVDIDKLVRDAKERCTPVAIVLAKEEGQLRQLDKDCRWSAKDGVWILRTTRQWLPRYLDILRPVLERMRTDGSDFLEKNAALAEQVRRTFVDIDDMEKELRKAVKAIDTAKILATNHKTRLQSLCDSALKKPAASASDEPPNQMECRRWRRFQSRDRAWFRELR